MILQPNLLYHALHFANFEGICVNHLSGPLRRQMSISKSSNSHGLWFVIGWFSSVLGGSVFQGSLLSGNYRLVCCQAVFQIFLTKVFLTCKNKTKSAFFPWQKYHHNFLHYFKQSRLILSFVFAANCVVIWKPKIPSKFAKCTAWYSEFYCKQRNFRNLCPKTSETCHLFPSKWAGPWKMT